MRAFALIDPARFHVHLENCTAKPRIFWLTPALARAAQRRHPDLAAEVRFTCGADFKNLARQLATARMLITSGDVVRDSRFPRGAQLASAAPMLELVQMIGAGIEAVLPLDWLPPGVRLANNSGVHVAKVREFLLMSLVALNCRLPAIVSSQRDRRWDQIFTSAIAGKTLAVVGLGDMGRAAVWAGRRLGLRVTGVRASGDSVPGVDRVYRPAQLRQALKGADFVVIATPLTPATQGLFDRRALESMKKGAGLINIGRAGVLDHEALEALLRAGWISGAILDVHAPEPLPADSPLWAVPNLVIVPHVSSDDINTYMDHTMDFACRNLRRLMSGRTPLNVIDPAAGY
jgi:phosphoglycerate dehydrogenase-like enzyme